MHARREPILLISCKYVPSPYSKTLLLISSTILFGRSRHRRNPGSVTGHDRGNHGSGNLEAKRGDEVMTFMTLLPLPNVQDPVGIAIHDL
jgi:hypothetical protein